MLIKSYAKINLFLEVISRTNDNYHKLQSLICFVNICDTIHIEEGEKFSLNFTGKYKEILEKDEQENLITKSINYMAHKFNLTPNLKITLNKNIPLQAGMGGGSSNCASTILAINDLFSLELSNEQLREIGLEMGCDVPICLNQKMALVEGIGEEISEIKFKTKPLFCIIVNPNKSLSTKKVFNSFSINRNKKILPIKPEMDLIEIIKNKNNILEAPAIKIVPEIKTVLDNIKEQNNCIVSRMSGSGATCFGLFENEDDLNQAAKNLKETFPNYYIQESPLIYEKL